VRHPLIRQGEGPAAAIERITAERQQHRRDLDRAHREAQTINTSAPTAGSPGGDSRKLRGIPAIGRNVAGAIPGTNPETELLRRLPAH
jgi:hypothetical protein